MFLDAFYYNQLGLCKSKKGDKAKLVTIIKKSKYFFF